LARALIVGCGCRGRELGRELAERGWEVRGTTRDSATLPSIEAEGIEGAIADPSRPGTLLELCGDVAMVVWLLGSAFGENEEIHGGKLQSLLERLVDSPVRGFAYEAVGSVDPEQLRAGRERVEHAAATWRIPVAFLERERSAAGWAAGAADSVIEAVS
jgi:nucleoside-diphosphate-sugar epimerase